MKFRFLGTILISIPLAACAAEGAHSAASTEIGAGGAGGGGDSGGAGGTGGSAGGPGGSGGPAWPLDRWIAFDSDREQFNRDIYVMRPDGSSLQRLTTESASDREPAFASDGKRLAFASDRVGSTMQIFILTLESGAVTQLTSRPEGADQPAWSADDQLIAFHSGPSVYTIKLDGTEEKIWFEGENEWNPFEHPVFSPDSTWIVADRGNQINAARLDGSEQKEIVLNTTNTQETPTISPTSALFAFATYCEPGIESVWVGPMSGLGYDPCTKASRLSPPGSFARRPAWGPYGYVAYELGTGSAEITVIPDKGGEPINVTNDPSDDRNPAWSPAGGAVIPSIK